MAKRKKRRGGPSRGQSGREISTKEKLATALYELLQPDAFGLNEFIERARSGYYGDYESPLATPLVQLGQDLRMFALQLDEDDPRRAAVFGFIERIIDGEFDATAEESSAWMAREGRYILAEALEDGSAGKPQRAGTADVTNSTYLTRRLQQVFEFLIADEHVQYTRADMVMALHNAHVWGLLGLLDSDSDVTPELRDYVLQSAVDTFRMRVDKERGASRAD